MKMETPYEEQVRFETANDIFGYASVFIDDKFVCKIFAREVLDCVVCIFKIYDPSLPIAKMGTLERVKTYAI